MYKQIKRKKLGRTKSHRDSLIRNLLRSLIENNFVVTTTPKAKVLKQEASSLIAKGKNMDLPFRRELQNVLGKDSLVKKYEEYVKKSVTGVGFVRVGFRPGDNAEVARIYLLGTEKKKTEGKSQESKEEKKGVEKKEEKKKSTMDIDKKKVDKTAVIKKTTRATSRAGI